MNSQIKKRLLRTAILSVFALFIGAGIGLFQISQNKGQVIKQAKIQPAAGVPGIQIGGDFTLVNHDGETVTDEDFADGYKLVFFGFTFCPEICPTELQKMAKVLDDLGHEADDIYPVFITVDPERDTPDVMREYVSLFHDDIIGLTGTPEQIDHVEKQYRVFARKAQDENMSDYAMDHSTFMYLMSPDNKLLGLYRMKDDAVFIAGDIRKKTEPSQI